MEVKSPLIPNSQVSLVRAIETQLIKDGYLKYYNIDVSPYFEGKKHIHIYKCHDTNFRFYYPFNLDGDGEFYEKLQTGEFYYIPWKWEHEITLKYLSPNYKNILEVGSGGNGFVKNINSLGFDIIGLELNKASVSKGIKEGLNIIADTVQEHAEKFAEKYDVVCSFQVLEHIADPLSFLKGSVKCLKKGGFLIISVPNNESDFLKYNFDAVLNMPPHHMGLWDEKSLRALTNILDIEVVNTHFEPLQDYHIDGYTGVWTQRFIPNRYIRFIFIKLGLRHILLSYFKRKKSKIIGHSILMVFKKL